MKSLFRTFGPISNLESHLPKEWWKTLFNSNYLKTDGDIVENSSNTARDINKLLEIVPLKPTDTILDLCCGQGRHTIELALRGFVNIHGIDRSAYLIRIAKKRAKALGLPILFSEGDARKIRVSDSSQDYVVMMGNSFGYFEREEDDLMVLKQIRRVLKPNGKVIIDFVDGQWMKEHFELRSWEWIDRNHFVCRERSLSADTTRLISREVISHAEKGIIADQFYAERLYSDEVITHLLKKAGFSSILSHGEMASESTRNQDLGMMAKRRWISAVEPEKEKKINVTTDITSVTVLLGDPRLPDKIKRDGQFNPEDFETISLLKENLFKLNAYHFSFLDAHSKLIPTLLQKKPVLILNLCDEGFQNQADMELHVPALLDLMEIPYTGSPPACLAICYNKSLVRSLAITSDIPVPLETYLNPNDQIVSLPSLLFPAIVKPNFGDSSIGITQHAVVHNAKELITYIDTLKDTLSGNPILIQEFLQGSEYSVGIIGNPGKFEILPILEVNYNKLPDTLPAILAYEAKWIPDSPYWKDITYQKASLDEESKRKLIHYSTLLFEKLGCRDYARFDFRADSEGTIKLLEVNPNPGWCWDGKLNLMASFKGLSYAELLELILNAARERIPVSK